MSAWLWCCAPAEWNVVRDGIESLIVTIVVGLFVFGVVWKRGGE